MMRMVKRSRWNSTTAARQPRLVHGLMWSQQQELVLSRDKGSECAHFICKLITLKSFADKPNITLWKTRNGRERRKSLKTRIWRVKKLWKIHLISFWFKLIATLYIVLKQTSKSFTHSKLDFAVANSCNPVPPSFILLPIIAFLLEEQRASP